MIKTGIREALEGHQAWFKIGNQTFYCDPQVDEEYEEDGEKKIWSSKEYAEWYQKMLDKAFEKVLYIGDIPFKNCKICNGTELTVHHVIKCSTCNAKHTKSGIVT